MCYFVNQTVSCLSVCLSVCLSISPSIILSLFKFLLKEQWITVYSGPHSLGLKTSWVPCIVFMSKALYSRITKPLFTKVQMGASEF